MAFSKTRDERKKQQWRGWIGEWRASGLSVRAFCARRGLATHRFYYWRRVLEQQAAEKAAFVPVQVVADVSRHQPAHWSWCSMAGSYGSPQGLMRRPCGSS
jgi:hypothetical protein